MFTADIAAEMKASKMLPGVLKAVRRNNFINFIANNSCQCILRKVNAVLAQTGCSDKTRNSVCH